MKIFNEIRPEEIESGFQQPEPGYEGFILKPTDPYPGDYPRYQEPLPTETITEEIPEVSEGIIDAANLEGDIWGAFDEEPSLPNQEAHPEEPTQTPDEKSVDIESEPDIELEPNIEQVETDIEQLVAENQFDEAADIATIDTAVPKTETQKEPSSLSVDEELKKLLEEELARSAEKKAKKEAQSNSEITEIPIEQQEKPQFVAVEESGAKVDFIDMMSIDLNMPKADLTSESELESIEVIAQKKSKSKPKKEKVKPPQKDKGEKKPKGILFWVFSSVAGLLIVSVLSYFAFNYYLKTNSPLTKNDSTLAHKDTVNHKLEHKTEIKQAPVETNHDTSAKIELETKKVVKQTEIAHNETKPVATEEKIHSTNQKVPNPKKLITTAETHTTEPLPKRIVSQPKEAKKYEIATNVPATKPKEPTISTNEVQIYTIQVYATPSFEDAEFWRQKLTSMRINDVYISTQKVRDVIWYRVRFGKFNNRQQALDVAKQFGFSQTWVDRIQ